MALLGATALALAAAPVSGSSASASAAGAPAETTASLRAKRQVLVQRIAALTDQAAVAQARAADANRKLAMTRVVLDETRRRFAAKAVDAYLGGVQDSEDSQLRRKAWADALADSDRQALAELRAAKAAAEKDGTIAAEAMRDAQRAMAELDAARAALERTIADRVAYERALARNAARQAASGAAMVPRHRRATMSQAELMRTYRFGPGGVPEGLVATGQVLTGKASWYGPGFDGRPTASGAIYDQEGWTVAHRTLPLGTILLITHGDRSIVVLVNDRGPFVAGRILDLSHGVAKYLGTVQAGVATVRAEILVPS